MTFDIDFVDPSCAPGTGTLEVGGLNSFETLEMIRSLQGFNFIGFDLVEVLPPYDPTQITSLLAATIIHDFASLVALQLKEDEKRRNQPRKVYRSKHQLLMKGHFRSKL